MTILLHKSEHTSFYSLELFFLTCKAYSSFHDVHAESIGRIILGKEGYSSREQTKGLAEEISELVDNGCLAASEHRLAETYLVIALLTCPLFDPEIHEGS